MQPAPVQVKPRGVHKGALLAALGTAILATLLLLGYLRRFEQEASGGEPIALLVLRKAVEPGTVLTEEALAVRTIPAAWVERRAVREAERSRVVGLRVTHALQPNEGLFWSDLAVTADDRRDLSSLVRPGMRAVAIRATSDDKSFALLRPGDRVDVLSTFALEGSTHRQAVVLLQNVSVLTVGLETAAEPSRPAGTPSAQELVLHVSVTVPEAQLLALAAEKGRLGVALRNPDDVRITDGLADLDSSKLGDAKVRKLLGDYRKTPALPVKIPSSGGP
jgi:pilus assembly protein CpaB